MSVGVVPGAIRARTCVQPAATTTTPAPATALGFRVGFQQLAADVASPEMSIFGDANITHLQDTAWVDPGVEAHDVRDGNLTSSVTVSGTVDVNTTGTYTLTYTVSDAAGNRGKPYPHRKCGHPCQLCHRSQRHREPGNDLGGTGHIYDGSPESEAGAY